MSFKNINLQYLALRLGYRFLHSITSKGQQIISVEKWLYKNNGMGNRETSYRSEMIDYVPGIFSLSLGELFWYHQRYYLCLLKLVPEVRF